MEEVGRQAALATLATPGMAAAPWAAPPALAAAIEANRRGQQLSQLSRRCSLVDLTVSRHERRESMAAAHAAHGTHPPGTAKGTAKGAAGIGKTQSSSQHPAGFGFGLYDVSLVSEPFPFVTSARRLA